MLLRDAQEETRILYTAPRDSAQNWEDPLLSYMAEVG